MVSDLDALLSWIFQISLEEKYGEFHTTVDISKASVFHR